MFCTSCGTKNVEESNYCKQCGHRLDRATPPRISEEEFDRALPEDEQVTALLERAYRARKEGDTAEAIRLCEEALHLRHESTSAHSLLGQLYEQTGDRERAIREYERVLRLNPGSIADRVKLDELRGEAAALPAKKSPPHIVLVDRESANDRWNPRVWGVLAVGVILMLLSGILYLEMRPHDTPRGNLAALKDETPLGTQLANVAQNTQPPANASSGPQYSSALPYPTLWPNQQQPTINYIYPPAPASSPRTISTGSNVPPYRPDSSHLPDMRGSNGSGDRERLQPNEDGSGSEYTINVEGNDGSNPGKGTSTPPAKNGSKGTPEGPGSVKVIPNAGPGPVLPATNGDARAAIALGDDKFMRGEYQAAIDNYRKALGNAGDDTAYVYEHIAKCFQNLLDKTNAVNYYQKAIEEYQKLISAGRNVEQAKNAIKVCQSGIKVCSN